ncbi:MAG TPA: tail fiber protein [Reyranella sp.]|nr:tail fiber protein [Reyranella sp.]
MAEPFTGQISIFGFNFAPRDWAQCQGQIVPIQQNTALFALLGTFYGGNGTSTFGLPNLQGSVVPGQGQARSGQQYDVGDTGGAANITITNATAPIHNHNFMEVTTNVSSNSPTGNVMGKVVGPTSGRLVQEGKIYTPTPPAPSTIITAPMSTAGGSQSHTNLQPFLVLNYCIALYGVFPARP